MGHAPSRCTRLVSALLAVSVLLSPVLEDNYFLEFTRD